jgi:hypothetical protein
VSLRAAAAATWTVPPPRPGALRTRLHHVVRVRVVEVQQPQQVS